MSGAVLVVGATSGIARAVAREMARDGRDLVLAARDEEALAELATDLEVRSGVRALRRRFDATDFEGHAAFFADCAKAFPEGLEGVFLCHGAMAGQAEAQRDFALARQMIDVNYTSYVSLLELAAAHFAARGSGWLAAVSSVAGDRGRASNYLYGSTKAALQACLSGLRGRLAGSGVAVIDVRPGPVETPLTWGHATAGPAASPERVARDIWRAILRRRAVVYTPFYWRFVMAVIRALPRVVFDRLRL